MPDLKGAKALAITLCLLAAVPVGAQPAESSSLQRVEVSGRKLAPSAWQRAESQHFVVYSDARDEDVAVLLDNLEKLDHLLRIYAVRAGAAAGQEPKLTLYYHARVGDLARIDTPPAEGVGLYTTCASGVQGFAVQLDRIESQGDAQLDKAALNDTLSAAFEAYARHFLYRHSDIRVPASFVEGFAQYFSSLRFSATQMVVGRMPTALAGYLKFIDSGRKYSLEWEDVLEGRLDKAQNYGGQSGVRLEFQAKSWLLTHYMLASADRRKRLSGYLALVAGGLAPTRAFERSFGLKLADLDKTIWRYSLRGVEALRVVPPSLPVARLSWRTLPFASGEFVLADAALRACPQRQAGEALLRKVAALADRYPRDPMGRVTLGRAQLDWGDPGKALLPLAAALEDDESSFDAHHLAGLAHLRLAGRGEGEARRSHLQEAQRHLQRARALNPSSAEAALAAFDAELALGKVPDAAVLEGVIAAWRTARELDGLARAAALAYAFTGRADDADRLLGVLAQQGHNAPLGDWARQWQAKLQAGVSLGDILAEMRHEPVADLPVREWTVDHRRVLQEVQRSYGLEAAESFIKGEQQRQDAARPSSSGSLGVGPVKR